jgi:hypothetical protein
VVLLLQLLLLKCLSLLLLLKCLNLCQHHTRERQHWHAHPSQSHRCSPHH